MRVTLTQHAVGQGGLMSGLIETQKGGTFHWVYDCGSNQGEARLREIQMVASNHVDVLFLSHLDADHINGIDELVTNTTVAEVVLPYLNNMDRLIAAAHADSTGRLTGGFLTFLSNIEGWFIQRGVQKVTYIDLSNNDDGGPFSDFGEIAPDDGDDGPIKPKWSDELGDGKTDDLKTPNVMSSSATLALSTQRGFLNWVLSPFAHGPSAKKRAVFKAEIESLIQSDEDIADLLKRFLSDNEVRENIRNAYDVIWSNHNLVSMALYTGPLRVNPRPIRFISHLGYTFHTRHPEPSCGWMGTGDMNLKGKRRKNSFVNFYTRSNFLDLTGVFQLPHHGSSRDIDCSILNKMTNLRICYAAAGQNSYGHPAKNVIQSVNSAQLHFHKVSDKGRSTLKEVIQF